MKKTLLLILLTVTINNYSQTQRLDNIDNMWFFLYDSNNLYQGYEIPQVEQENVTYNPEGLVEIETYKEWTGTSYENDKKNVFTYGVNQKPNQKVFYLWSNNQWIESETYQYTYNTDNLLTEYITSGDRRVFTYNTNNKIIFTETFNWDDNTNDYSQNASVKNEYIYDNNENIATSILYVKNENNEWVIEGKTEYTYDNNYIESDLIIPFPLTEEGEKFFWFSHKIIQAENFGYNPNTSSYISQDVNILNYSNLVLSTNNINIQNYTVYPNPTTNQVKFNITDFEKIEIYDITGKLITKTKTNIVNMENVPSGTYLYRIQKGNKTINGKIIKK